MYRGVFSTRLSEIFKCRFSSQKSLRLDFYCLIFVSKVAQSRISTILRSRLSANGLGRCSGGEYIVNINSSETFWLHYNGMGRIGEVRIMEGTL